jgi:hypothetical protein
MVVVVASLGEGSGLGLTGEDGLFAVRVPHPGRYRATVDRIGYESTTTSAFDVPPEGTYQAIPVAVRPVRLEGLDISGSRRCEVGREVGQATARVWEEARKALETARWTAETGRYAYTLLQFSRRWDTGARRILEERREFLDRRGAAPYASVTAGELASRGFVWEIFPDVLSYHAPDAAVLLSDSFLATHCLRVHRASDGMLALDFEPVAGRSLPEIEGTIWVDAATAELRRVEYRYLNLDRGRAAGAAGGELAFERTGDGAWFVADWHVRMPLLERGRAVGYRRVGYEDKGGTVWRALDAGGTSVYRAVTGRVTGVVRDSLGAPLPGVAFRARGLEVRGESAAGGDYVLEGIPEGLTRIDVAAPHLDTLGLTTLDSAVSAVLPKGGSAEIDLRIPGVGERLRSHCGGEPPAGTSILLGRVRRSGAPAQGITVRISRRSGSRRFRVPERATPPGGTVESRWRPIADTPWWEAKLDGRGLFLLCDVPYPSVVRVAADFGDDVVESDITLASGAAVVVTTLVSPRRPGSPVLPRPGTDRAARSWCRAGARPR